jgi:hypothetical protein
LHPGQALVGSAARSLPTARLIRDLNKEDCREQLLQTLGTMLERRDGDFGSALALLINVGRKIALLN